MSRWRSRLRAIDLPPRMRVDQGPAAFTRAGRAVAILVAPDVFGNLTREAEDAVFGATLHIDCEEQDSILWEQVKTALALP